MAIHEPAPAAFSTGRGRRRALLGGDAAEQHDGQRDQHEPAGRREPQQPSALVRALGGGAHAARPRSRYCSCHSGVHSSLSAAQWSPPVCAQRGGAARLVVLGIGAADPVLEVAEELAHGAAPSVGDHVRARVEPWPGGEGRDVLDVGVGERQRRAGVLEIVGVVLKAQGDRLVLEQRVALGGGEVAEELRDEDQPQRVVP